MNIRIQAKDFPLTPTIRSTVADQVERALARFDSRILDIDVFLSDVNGPTGGPDTVCTIRVQLPNRTTVPIETVESDLYSAIRRACPALCPTHAGEAAASRTEGDSEVLPCGICIDRGSSITPISSVAVARGKDRCGRRPRARRARSAGP